MDRLEQRRRRRPTGKQRFDAGEDRLERSLPLPALFALFPFEQVLVWALVSCMCMPRSGGYLFTSFFFRFSIDACKFMIYFYFSTALWMWRPVRQRGGGRGVGGTNVMSCMSLVVRVLG